MKKMEIFILWSMLILLLLIVAGIFKNTYKDDEIIFLEQQIEELNLQIEKLTKENNELKEDKELIREMYDELKKTLYQDSSRGSYTSKLMKKVTLEATAYTLREEECGKSIDHPQYGITASGNKVEVWNTVAMDKSIPFGTKIYIPYFDDKPNKGIFTVHDRGGLIKSNNIDIYMEDLSDALKFGRRELEVYILK